MRVLTFNSQATQAIQGRKGAKLRLDFKDDTLMVRPTDRKAGPHILTELDTKGKGVQIQITDKELEKLGVGSSLSADQALGLRADKYGWFALVAQDGEGVIDGSEIKIVEKAE